MLAAWNAEREDLLRELVPQGHSYSVIAERISMLPGPPISRNAAIGKATRLGIAQSRAGYASLSRKQRAARKITSKPRLIRPDRLLQAKIEAFRAEPDIVVPPQERRGVLELTDKCCRWPYGTGGKDDPYYFCGKPKLMGGSYCPFHAARAFAAPQPRRPTQPVPAAPAASEREEVSA